MREEGCRGEQGSGEEGGGRGGRGIRRGCGSESGLLRVVAVGCALSVDCRQ